MRKLRIANVNKYVELFHFNHQKSNDCNEYEKYSFSKTFFQFVGTRLKSHSYYPVN